MPSLAGSLSNAARRTVYSAGQAARIAWYTGHYIAGRRRMGALTEPGEAPYADEFAPLDRTRLRDSFRELFRQDWRNIRTGEYKMPLELRRPLSPAQLLRQSADYFRDTDKVARRKSARAHSEVLRPELAERYPRYFLQNFHYQSDGWFSEASAERYEMQVETLFTGSAAAMRRQALPALRRAIGDRDTAGLSMIDLGCGAGRFIEEVKDNWPLLNVTALDLSPAYLGRARTTLGGCRGVDFVEANAEDTGLAGKRFDLATSVYLFHELPPKARKNVVRETARLLKPGGVYIHVDTIQYGDEPGLDILLENFPRGFHEPYYDSYCRLALAPLLHESQLSPVEEYTAFLTKVSVFRRTAG